MSVSIPSVGADAMSRDAVLSQVLYTKMETVDAP